MSCYLRRLEDVFSSLGGTIVDRLLIPSDLLKLSKEFDYMVSCCGLGARELVGDENVVPVEGIVVHVKPANEVKSITLAHTGKIFGRRPVYVVPRGGPNPDIVLGGTLGERRGGYPRHFPWPVPEKEWRIRGDAERIVGMCSEIEPGLGSPSTIISNL
jgi:D-amino-acid oxidase